MYRQNEDLDRQIHEEIMGLRQLVEAPRYSSDPRKTLLVVEQLGKDGWYYGIEDLKGGNVVVTLANKEGKIYKVEADNVPAAICEAAMRTVLSGKN